MLQLKAGGTLGVIISKKIKTFSIETANSRTECSVIMPDYLWPPIGIQGLKNFLLNQKVRQNW
uniref:Uncharacterized protein n=1 Tax=Anguilla anguilla TaxID=7936 RepID=A0A0E9QYB6_ANGAN